MNVLFFTHHLNNGGTEKTVRTLATYYNTHDLGVKSYICVVYDDPDMEDYPENVIVMRHRSQEQDSKFRKGLNVLAQIREMREIKRKYHIDVCVSFLPGADIINVLSGVGERQIVSVRSQESLFVHNILKKWYVQAAYKRCDYIVACSETVRRDCISYFGAPENKIVTINNAAGPLFSNGEVSLEYQQFVERHLVYITVGRLAPEKGHVHLLRAYADLERRHAGDGVEKDPGLVFIGDGELRKELEQLADELGIADQVLFCGRQPNPADYLNLADVFVLSSNVEGAANVLVEALQCGAACISTECGAARDVLAPGSALSTNKANRMEIAEYGILVPVCGKVKESVAEIAATSELSDEEHTLADAMERMYTDKELRMRYREHSQQAIESLSLDHICERWAEVIHQVAGQ